MIAQKDVMALKPFSLLADRVYRQFGGRTKSLLPKDPKLQLTLISRFSFFGEQLVEKLAQPESEPRNIELVSPYIHSYVGRIAANATLDSELSHSLAAAICHCLYCSKRWSRKDAKGRDECVAEFRECLNQVESNKGRDYAIALTRLKPAEHWEYKSTNAKHAHSEFTRVKNFAKRFWKNSDAMWEFILNEG